METVFLEWHGIVKLRWGKGICSSSLRDSLLIISGVTVIKIPDLHGRGCRIVEWRCGWVEHQGKLGQPIRRDDSMISAMYSLRK